MLRFSHFKLSLQGLGTGGLATGVGARGVVYKAVGTLFGRAATKVGDTEI